MLRDDQDAHGHLMYDFLEGRNPVEIVERDDHLIEPSSIGPQYYFSEFKNWSPREKLASKFLKGRVLDVGCGAGRWSLYAQRRGHDVLGIDLSPLAVKVCRLRGVMKVKEKSILQISPRLGRFDTILMMGNNFGLFGGPKRARILLNLFHKTTSPEARIIAESLDVYKPPVEEVHRRYHLRNRRRGRMPGQVRIRIRYKTYATPWFDYLLVSPPEMKTILKGTGWSVMRFFRSGTSPAYVAVITKARR